MKSAMQIDLQVRNRTSTCFGQSSRVLVPW